MSLADLYFQQRSGFVTVCSFYQVVFREVLTYRSYILVIPNQCSWSSSLLNMKSVYTRSFLYLSPRRTPISPFRAHFRFATSPATEETGITRTRISCDHIQWHVIEAFAIAKAKGSKHALLLLVCFDIFNSQESVKRFLISCMISRLYHRICDCPDILLVLCQWRESSHFLYWVPMCSMYMYTNIHLVPHLPWHTDSRPFPCNTVSAVESHAHAPRF